MKFFSQSNNNVDIRFGLNIKCTYDIGRVKFLDMVQKGP